MRFIPILLCLVALAACTGSREDNPNLKLVVAVRGSSSNPNQPFTITCNGQSQSFTAPGLLLGSVEALVNTGNASTGTCNLQSLAAQPYDLLNTASGSRVYVSLPALARIERYSATANGLALDPAFALQAIPGFCPTRIALSPNETVLVALDDPADTNSGCDNTAPRDVRLGVFNVTTGALVTEGLKTVASSADRLRGPVAFALNDSSLIALEPFAGRYRLERWALSTLSAQQLTSSDNVTTGFNASGAAVDAALTGAGFLVSSAAFDGNTLGVILQDNGADVVRFGAAAQAVLQAGQLQNIGPTARIVNTTLQSSSLTAFLRPSSILFKRDAQPSDANRVDAVSLGIAATDLTFTPDGFAWALSGSSLQKIDTASFPVVSSVGGVSLGAATALSLGWVVQP